MRRGQEGLALPPSSAAGCSLFFPRRTKSASLRYSSISGNLQDDAIMLNQPEKSSSETAPLAVGPDWNSIEPFHA
jgi:hypothetical protein